MVRRARQQRKRPLEPPRLRAVLFLQAQVPLPGHGRVVAAISQQLGQRHDLVVQVTLVPRLSLVCRRLAHQLRERAEAGDVVVRSSLKEERKKRKKV